jgi:hypothetical protein
MKLIFLLLPFLLQAFAPVPLQAQPSLPASCVPKTIGMTRVRSAKTLAIIAYRGSNYHYLSVEGMRRDESLRAVIRQKQDKCYLSFVDPGEAYSLSEGLPIPVAKTLSIATTQQQIKAKGGVAAYQKWFLNKRFKTIAPEDAYALKKLGIQLPSSIKILPWSKIKAKERLITNAEN